MLWFRFSNISFKYPQQSEDLLSEISFTVNHDSKIGLVGANGSGKSTLFKLLQGALQPSTGDIYQHQGLSIAYLPQTLSLPASKKAEDYLWELQPGLADLKARLDDINHAFDPDSACAYSEFYEQGGYAFAQQIQSQLQEVALPDTVLARPISTLSGGEKTKLALCRLLLSSPDLLLLDEPTNHLDESMLVWLENYLTTSKLPFIVATHDRCFLDRVVNTVFVLEKNSLESYEGNYSAYQTQKAHALENAKQAYERSQQKIRQLKAAKAKLVQWARKKDNHSAKKERALKSTGPKCQWDVKPYVERNNMMHRAAGVTSRFEREADAIAGKKPWIDKKRTLKVEVAHTLQHHHVLTIEDLSHAWDKTPDKTPLFSSLNMTLYNGERVAITGPNGCGKSTLLNIIMGGVAPSAGQYHWASNAKIGYLSQDNKIIGDAATVSVIDYLLAFSDHGNEQAIYHLLGQLVLKEALLHQKINSLSPGEQHKVSLARLLLQAPNVLVLDEPTNHLEIAARENLERALQDFAGTVLFVSHDRVFRERVMTREISYF